MIFDKMSLSPIHRWLFIAHAVSHGDEQLTRLILQPSIIGTRIEAFVNNPFSLYVFLLSFLPSNVVLVIIITDGASFFLKQNEKQTKITWSS